MNDNPVFGGHFRPDFTDKEVQKEFIAHRTATDPDFAAWYEQTKGDTSSKFANAFSLAMASIIGFGLLALTAVGIWRLLAWLISL